MKTARKKSEAGFTLVELLIVIAILGILMALALAGMRFAQQRARDLQRQNAVRNLSTALESYYVDNRVYPSSATVGNTQNLIDNYLNEYLEDAFELPSGVTDANAIGYVSSSNSLTYAVCMYRENSSDIDDLIVGGDTNLKTQCAAQIVGS